MQKRFKKVYLEISNICNLQCSFCPVVERDKLVLDREKFKSYLHQIVPLTERVCLHVMGEPLNHPDFADFVQIAKSEKAPLEITTNGTLLNAKNVQALLDNIVVQVNFSLQSFADNFPHANPQTYIDKIFDFCDQATVQRPDLYINFRLWNLQDCEDKKENEFFLTAIEKHFNVAINRNVDVAHIKSKNVSGRIYLHFDSRFKWPDPKDPALGNRGTCHGTRSHLAIHADGKVVPCCLDKEAEILLGDMNEQSLGEVINSHKFNKMHDGFAQGNLVEDLCRKCTYVRRFSGRVRERSSYRDSNCPT